MDHLAILTKKKYLPLILAGKKTIESRWYTTRRAPWNRIKKGETIYFKESGEPVTAKATVQDIIQTDNLTPEKIQTLLKKYEAFLGVPPERMPTWSATLQQKHYSILIFLEKAQTIEPFVVSKKGYGNMAAWISVENITQLQI